MTTDDTEHDIRCREAYAVQRNGMASARCLTHQTETAEQWNTLSYACQGFRCDEGRGLRFIIETTLNDDAPVPVMRDLSGLARIVHGNAEARAYDYERPETRVWLWLGGGNLEELRITAQPASKFDENDYAYQTWAITRADDRIITTVRVRIDGRS